MKKSKALVVGGGSGIGLSLCKKLLQEGYEKVYIADNNFSLCCDLVGIETIKIDLSKDDLSVLMINDIDTLIITAGIGRLAMFESFTTAEIRKTFAINTISCIEIIKMYYEKLINADTFNVSVITSIAGVVASPLYAIYSASKGALVKFIEAVNAELQYKGSKNRILNVAPGKVEGTKFHGGENHANRDLEILTEEIYNKMQTKQELYIPKYDIYKGVIDRYNANAIKFAEESLIYKMQNSKLQEKRPAKVGYMSGTFDLFHVGHLNIIKRAKQICDYLIVGVHKDASHKNKQVIIPLEARMEIVKNIKYVDEVIVSPTEDKDAYDMLKFDILIVGDDYKGTERFARYEEYFKTTGTEIAYMPYTKTVSSTMLRSQISEGKKNDNN